MARLFGWITDHSPTVVDRAPTTRRVDDRATIRQAVVEQYTAALLTGLDDLERDDHWGTLVRPGDVADLVHRVAAEVGR